VQLLDESKHLKQKIDRLHEEFADLLFENNKKYIEARKKYMKQLTIENPILME
jgi:hypothetical protein